jgi:hypothetical protein
MSFYETLSDKIVTTVPAQYDMQKDVYNQCSWFAFCMAAALKKNKWKIPKLNNLASMYKKALQQATKLRVENNCCPWGESIFSSIIHETLPLNTSIPYSTVVNINKKPNLLLHPSMEHIQAYKETLSSKSELDLYKQIKNLNGENNFMFVNRYGQSFLIYPFGEKYYIFDSHCRECGIFSYESVIKYLHEGHDDTYNFIIWIVGSMDSWSKSNYVIDKFFYDYEE